MMSNFTLRAVSASQLVLISSLAACNAADPEASATETSPASTAPATTPPSAASSAPTASGGAAGTPATQTGAASAAAGSGATAGTSTAGASAATGGAGAAPAASAAGAGSGGAGAAERQQAAGSAAAGSGGTAGAAARQQAGTGAAAGTSAAAGTGAADAGDEKAFASGLSELFIDAACDAATRAPLEMGATCNHTTGTQRIEKMVSFGGDASTTYQVTLRVRGIWEPTNVTGGMRPLDDAPFTVGGQVASGAGSSSDSINYQQYFIEVAQPKQTYWLNDYQYVAHDIHKEDYEASITVAGGAQIKVVMNDGNEREIANFPKEMFSDLPPYDKMPTLGQLLRLDVVSVEAMP